MAYSNPINKLKFNENIENIKLFSAGPTNISKTVLEAGLMQPLTSINHFAYQIMDDIQAMTRYVYQTSNELTLAAHASGNGGNEIMITNLADPGETVLIAVSGVWSTKMADMAKRYNLNVAYMEAKERDIFTLEDFEVALRKYKPILLCVVHGDSSSGILQPLEGLGQLCHKYDCLLAVDAVVSFGVSPIFLDEWKIDAINSASQKGLGAPPGISLLSFSSRAHKKILSKKFLPPYYFDIKTLSQVWNCFGQPRTYHYTYNVSLLAMIRQALKEICEEGLENVWKRHKEAAEFLYNRLEAIGLEMFIERKEIRFCGVSCVKIPKEIKWPALLDYIFSKYNIEIGFGVGPSLGQNIRIGLLGQNADVKKIPEIVNALQEGIKYCLENKSEGNDSRPEVV